MPVNGQKNVFYLSLSVHFELDSVELVKVLYRKFNLNEPSCWSSTSMNNEVLQLIRLLVFHLKLSNKILQIPFRNHYRQSSTDKRPTIGNISDFLSALKPLICPWEAKGKSLPWTLAATGRTTEMEAERGTRSAGRQTTPSIFLDIFRTFPRLSISPG